MAETLSQPKLIRTYWTSLHGQQVEVKVYKPGKSKKVEVADCETEEQIVIDDSIEGKDLVELLQEGGQYGFEKEET